MIVEASRVDDYLRAKGIAYRMSDDEWSATIAKVSRFLGPGNGFRVKLLHQREDPLRRSYPDFPNDLPTPFRLIDYIELFVGAAPKKPSLVDMMKDEGIPHFVFTHPNGPEDDDVVTLVRIGPRG